MSDSGRIHVILTDEQLELLRGLHLPCEPGLLESAARVRNGRRISATIGQLQAILGWVAGEANHSDQRSRRAEVLHAVADEIEGVLGEW
jgi:hypothetical protein